MGSRSFYSLYPLVTTYISRPPTCTLIINSHSLLMQRLYHVVTTFQFNTTRLAIHRVKDLRDLNCTLQQISGKVSKILHLIPAPSWFYQQNSGTFFNFPNICWSEFFFVRSSKVRSSVFHCRYHFRYISLP